MKSQPKGQLRDVLQGHDTGCGTYSEAEPVYGAKMHGSRNQEVSVELAFPPSLPAQTLRTRASPSCHHRSCWIRGLGAQTGVLSPGYTVRIPLESATESCRTKMSRGRVRWCVQIVTLGPAVAMETIVWFAKLLRSFHGIATGHYPKELVLCLPSQ